MATREQDLTERLNASCEECRRLGYSPTMFDQMVTRYGVLGTCKRLLRSGAEPYGFQKLIKMGRPDLTIEAIALDFPDLFDEEELEIARWRLRVVRESMSA